MSKNPNQTTLAKDQKDTESCYTSQLVHSSEYWLSDGNTILRAKDTLFRVHLSVLARHSDFFTHIATVPQPVEEERKDEVIDGCPVISLSDSAKDIEVLLSILYDPVEKPIPIHVLSAMLRLGRKYAIRHLEQEAIERLHTDFPTSFQEWDDHFHDTSRPVSRSFKLIDCERHDYEDSYDPILNEVINLAHEYDIKTLLPAAYASYLIKYSLKNLLRNDYILRRAKDECIIGRANIVNFVKKEQTGRLVLGPILCSKTGPKPKTGYQTSYAGHTQKINNPMWRVEDCLLILGPILDYDTLNLCSECEQVLRLFSSKIRGELWEKLPSFFDLDGLDSSGF